MVRGGPQKAGWAAILAPRGALEKPSCMVLTGVWKSAFSWVAAQLPCWWGFLGCKENGEHVSIALVLGWGLRAPGEAGQGAWSLQSLWKATEGRAVGSWVSSGDPQPWWGRGGARLQGRGQLVAFALG